jgi:hypothetical protein
MGALSSRAYSSPRSIFRSAEPRPRDYSDAAANLPSTIATAVFLSQSNVLAAPVPKGCRPQKRAQRLAFEALKTCVDSIEERAPIDSKASCASELKALIQGARAFVACAPNRKMTENTTVRGEGFGAGCADCSSAQLAVVKSKADLINCASKWRYVEFASQVPEDDCESNRILLMESILKPATSPN